MKILIFILYAIFSQSVFGQISDCKLQEDNHIWIAKFESQYSNSEKIKLVKQKIKFDAIYTETKPIVPETEQPNAKTENINSHGQFCGCRIRFFLQVGKDNFVEANLNAKPKLTVIIDSLNSKNINNIEYVNANDAIKLFGPKAKCGVIYLYIKNKKLRRQINAGT